MGNFTCLFTNCFDWEQEVAERLQKIIAKSTLVTFLHQYEGDDLMFLTTTRRYAPRDADDVLRTERMLSEGLGLPLPLVWQIIEYAEYWVRSLGRCGNLTVEAFDAEIQESRCCTATIPPYVKKYKPLRKLVITIESHDQGVYLFVRVTNGVGI